MFPPQDIKNPAGVKANSDLEGIICHDEAVSA
jgi:hypothetical protein